MPSVKSLAITIALAVIVIALTFRIGMVRKLVVGDGAAVKTWSV